MKASFVLTAGAVLGTAFAQSSSSSTAGLPTATVANGVVVGTTTVVATATATVNKFLGIPYAQPPVRFEKPVAAENWSTPKNVSAFQAACLQQFVGGSVNGNFTKSLFASGAPSESEDCLYLNVYVPTTKPPTGGFPVLFWIYGGALQFGAGSGPYYDGSSFAANQDVILVTHNYRTNVFGFPTSPELGLTDRNLGFYDQRLALNWTSHNIAAFGGNKDKVTIFGESAGGQSTDALLTSEWLYPPFHAAIMQSGNLDLFGLQEVGYNGTNSWASLAAGLNCTAGQSNLTCAKNANATTILNIITAQSLPFIPVVDYVTRSPGSKFSRGTGTVAPVPVMMGSNGQEGRLFQIGMNNITSYVDSTFGLVPTVAQQILKAYAVGTPGITSDYDAISQIYTEFVFQCTAAREVNQTRNADIPVWRYLYNATIYNIQPIPNLVNLEAFHSSEIPLVFGTYNLTGNSTTREVNLSKFMQTAWANFAKDPIRGPGWAPVGAVASSVGVLGTNGSSGVISVKAETVDSRCSIFDPLYTYFGF